MLEIFPPLPHFRNRKVFEVANYRYLLLASILLSKSPISREITIKEFILQDPFPECIHLPPHLQQLLLIKRCDDICTRRSLLDPGRKIIEWSLVPFCEAFTKPYFRVVGEQGLDVLDDVVAQLVDVG
jgi:hypothetical protein